MTRPPRRPGADIQYSRIAADQLDALQAAEPELYDDVLATCSLIFTNSSRAQSMSAAITTESGIIMRLAVPSRHPFKVFWTTETPRVEAVFPYP